MIARPSALMIRARSWNVSLRSAGPPTSLAWRSIAPKSRPPDPVVATGAPSIALGISTAPSPATHRSRS